MPGDLTLDEQTNAVLDGLRDRSGPGGDPA